jgi:hypothetical protein
MSTKLTLDEFAEMLSDHTTDDLIEMLYNRMSDDDLKEMAAEREEAERQEKTEQEEASLETCKCGLYQTCDICKMYQER